MHIRTANTDHAPRQNEVRSTLIRSKLDWAIIISVLAMAAFNLVVMADNFGVTKAYAAAPACGIGLA